MVLAENFSGLSALHSLLNALIERPHAAAHDVLLFVPSTSNLRIRKRGKLDSTNNCARNYLAPRNFIGYSTDIPELESHFKIVITIYVTRTESAQNTILAEINTLGRGPGLTEVEKTIIETLTNEGKSQRQIARTIKRDKKAVLNFQKKLETKKSPAKLGRPPKLSQRDKNSLIRRARLQSLTARELVFIAQDEWGINIGIRRIQQILKNAPFLRYTKMRCSPKLTTLNKDARLKFALKYLKCGAEFWSTVIFSDEKKFNMDGSDGHAAYWADTRVEKRYFSRRVRGGDGVMVWAAISSRGKTQLVFIENNMNAVKYTELLSNYLVPFIESKHGEETYECIFQHDNAPAHSAIHTKEWLMDNIIPTIEWPDKSPDINVIENAWGAMVLDVYQGYRQFDYIDDLKEAIVAAWDRLSLKYISNLIKSVPTRLANVLLMRGGVTSY